MGKQPEHIYDTTLSGEEWAELVGYYEGIEKASDLAHHFHNHLSADTELDCLADSVWLAIRAYETRLGAWDD